MSGTRKRRGTTLVELSLVIAILAMVALPFAAFVSQNLKNTVLSSTQLKEQVVLEQVMQDMEKHLRSAISMNGTTPCPITFPTDGISFTSRDPQALLGSVPTPTGYRYVLASGLLTRTIGPNSGTFPNGLEANMITSVTFPTGTGLQHLVAATPPCYLTVRIEAYNTTLQRATALQKTIYLRNYTSIVNIARILGVTAPAAGAPPVTAIAETVEYTGAVTWLPPVTTTFAPGNAYMAVVALTAKPGYTLTGVAANFFTVAGASVAVPNAINAGVVTTGEFPMTVATQLTITGTTLTTSKPYDGNTTAVVTAGTLIGVVSPDIVTVTAVATYDTAAVGMGKTITVVYTLGGAQAGNYVEPVSYTATGTIGQKALTVTATGPTKVYGTALTAGTSATNFTASGAIAGETVTSVTLTPDAAGLSATTAAGAAYVVTPSLATGTGGFLASNYTITYAAYNGTVSKKALTVTATGPTKVYGTALTTGTSTTNFTAGATGVGSEVVTSVTLTPNAAGLSATTAAGAAYVVTPSLATGTGGFLASNYLVTYTAYNGTVSAKPLTIAAPALTLSKPYDGNTTAAVTAGALSGVVSPDVVTVTAVATYDTAAVGVGKTITVVYTLGGAQAGNYVKPVNYTVATGVITTKQLTIAAPALTLSKPYDGNTTAAVTAGALSGVVGGDTVTVSAVATYNTAAVGVGKTITVVYTLGGAQAGNYVKPVNYTTAAGVITLAPINMAAILGVTVPVQGATPVTTITATTQYTGTVTWTPALTGGGKFKNATVYTATITLTPKAGYTLTGVAANFFTVAGATTVTNPVNSGVVTAVFPTT